MDDFVRENPRLWKWGFIYYNRNDESLIVSKRIGLGWTFNFAHRSVYLFLFALIFIIFLAAYYLK